MNMSDYLALFPGASREKPKLMALARAVLRQAMDLVPLTEQLLSGFSFALAEGSQLDALAAASGLARTDMNLGSACPDADFREYLLAKLALWTWDGTNRTVPAVLAKAGIGRQMRDGLDGSVEITGAGQTPRADYEKLFPIPAGISWQGIVPRPPIILEGV